MDITKTSRASVQSVHVKDIGQFGTRVSLASLFPSREGGWVSKVFGGGVFRIRETCFFGLGRGFR